MAQTEISRDDKPIRLFKSDVLEFFTHIHPAVVVVIWLPIAGYAFVRAAMDPGIGWGGIVLGAFLGLVIWTLAEYTLHRFVFHFKPRTSWQERLSFLFHGVHHAQPRSKTRLVMPPVVSIPLGLLFYGLFVLIVGGLFRAPAWVAPLFGGFTLGYLTYDITHYATHHFRMKHGYFKWVRRHHMLHHAQTPNQRFGVSSPLWDYVFGTEPGQDAP
ncbi:MAG: sterol desaturase family protein [Anaerolineae bacterium]|nr:sterol desaturase family protein [Anaerolineae bacterium]